MSDSRSFVSAIFVALGVGALGAVVEVLLTVGVI